MPGPNGDDGRSAESHAPWCRRLADALRSIFDDADNDSTPKTSLETLDSYEAWEAGRRT